MMRLTAFITLVIALVTLSGLGVTASAMVRASAVDTCCKDGHAVDHGPEDAHHNEWKGKEAWGGHCNGAGCLCVFCLPDDLNTQFLHGPPPILFTVAVESSSPINLSGFIIPIEYPPEAA